MRFDPFRELDRLAEQTLSAGARALHVVAASVPAQAAAAAEPTPA
jgi:hypothetical protein